MADSGLSADLRTSTPSPSWTVPSAALSVLGGVCLSLSGEPWALWPCGFVGLGILLQALSRASGFGPRAAPRDSAPVHAQKIRDVVRQGAVTGLLFGSAVNAVALFSIIGLLQDFGHIPLWGAVPIALLAFVAQGLPYATCGALTAWCVRLGLPRWLAFPPCLVLGLSLTPQLFPWHPAGPQVNFLWFSQMADLGGEALIDCAMALVASGLWQALQPAQVRRARLVPASIALLTLGLSCGYGALRVAEIRTARASAQVLRVGVVQGNVGIEVKRDDSRTGEILRDLQKLTAQLEREGADLTVWAETAYPHQLLRSRKRQPTDERRILNADVHGPILLGAVTYLDQDDDRYEKYNSAWLLQQDGRFGDRIDKSRLLAFGEFIPFWDLLPPLRSHFRSRGFTPGENGVIQSGEAKLGILICYEDLFAHLSRKVVQRGALLLVNMTNDAWFGRSHEPALHDMVARLRAVETRRDLIRAVNTGVSSFTSATGEALVQTPIFQQTAFVAEARLLSETSLYTSLGDWVDKLAALGLALCLISKRFRRAA